MTTAGLVEGSAGLFGWGRAREAYPGRARARGSREAREKGDVCVLGYSVTERAPHPCTHPTPLSFVFTRPLLRGPQPDDAAAVTAALGCLTLPSDLDVDCSYDELSGTYHNFRLNASNVWCTKVQPHLVAEAAATFERCGLRAAFRRLSTADKNNCGDLVKCVDGECFFANRAGWKSDVGWLSADNQSTHDSFVSLFRRMGVAETFEPIIGAPVHLYTAFFVVRSMCTAPDLHVDYGNKVKTTALTLMTPLYEEYSAVEDFQLLYLTNDKSLRRYRYQLGEAIVFGARFYHSTEPGVAALDLLDPDDKHDPASSSQPGGLARKTGESCANAMPTLPAPSTASTAPARRAHAYLCFTFGSNREEDWGPISETVDGQQTRQLSRPGQPNGGNHLSLSKLGLRIEAGDVKPGGEDNPYAVSYGLEGDGMGDDCLKVGARQCPAEANVEEGGYAGRAGPGRLRRRRPKGMLK